MRILVTNDDGILAPGLAALYRAVEGLGEVAIVAPQSHQSAAGHAITVRDPLIIERVHVEGRFWGISVAGRPADCVKLAFRNLLEHAPDLVVSGINAGANLGINVLYSGTVAAAAEGAILGAKSVAFSLTGSREMDFTRAARYCRAVLDRLLAGGLAPGELINVNVPDLADGEPKGVKVVRQSVAGFAQEAYEARTDPRGRKYFWMADNYAFLESPDDTDVVASRAGYVTVTPLHVDLTATPRLASLERFAWTDALDDARG